MAKTSATKKSTAKKATGTKAKPSRKSTEKAAAAPKVDKQTGQLVSIEACKQWSVFKTRAGKIQKFLADNGSNARVEINKEKPGKGNFVVRIEGRDEPILELVGMKRPFADLKALDMEDIGRQVMEALDEEK